MQTGFQATMRCSRFVVLGITIALSGCYEPWGNNPEIRRFFNIYQPFVDEIEATYARTGAYPDNAQDLLFERDWPAFHIEASEVKGNFIVIPISSPQHKRYVSYGGRGTFAAFNILGIGRFNYCSWTSYAQKWGCPNSWP